MDNKETNANQPPGPPKKDLQQVEQEVSEAIDAQIKAMNDSVTSETKKQENVSKFVNGLKKTAINELDELQIVVETSKNKIDKNKLINQKREQVANELRKITVSAKKGIKVSDNPKTQAFITKLAEQSLSDYELVDIFQVLNEYILGSKEIVIGATHSREVSDFEQDIIAMEGLDIDAVIKIREALANNASLYGREPAEVRKRFAMLNRYYQEQQPNTIDAQTMEQLFSNFTPDQKNFMRIISNPDKFLEYINTERENRIANSGELAREIKEVYRKKYRTEPSDIVLKALIDRKVGIKISEDISGSVVNLLEHMYRQLNIEGTHKAFDQIENEDFLRGITAKRNVIMGALHGLESNLMIMEDQNPLDPRLIKLQKLTEEDRYTAEVDIKGNTRRVSRIKPLPYYKPVKLSEFITGQWSNFNHWREKTGYFHDVGLVYSEPPHEGSFYGALKGYSGRMTSIVLDGLFNLPDADITIQAFHLYDKFMQEAMAAVDHRIVPNLHTDQLEGINTQIEEKVIKYLKLEYKNEISMTNAINNAVGLAKGVFLTDPEHIAYCDPTDAAGGGAAVAYGTIDATPENVLSGGLHTIMRWQGPNNLRSVLFLQADGETTSFWKKLFGTGGWDHRVAMKNAEEYMNSFYDGKMGREGSKRNLVIDKLMNLTRTADFINRGGWRDYHRYSSHFMYNEAGKLQLLESFKSLDIIGYDPAIWFLKKIDSGVDITKTTYLEKLTGPEADQREELFKYVYERYFKPFSNQSYKDYIDDLGVRAKAMVKKFVIDNKTLPFSLKDYDKAVRKQMSELFVEGATTRFVAARFPTKFLRIDKDRFHTGGKSRYTQTFEKMKQSEKYQNLSTNDFSEIMNDLGYVEESIRFDMSHKIKEKIHMLPLDQGDDPNANFRTLGEYADELYNLDKIQIKRVLESKGFDKERIQKVEDLYDLIFEKITGKSEERHDENGNLIKENLSFLDGEGWLAIKEFPFNIGVENTDMSLIAFRGSGPRPVARAIGDMASMEEVVIKGFLGLPEMFKKIALDGNYEPLLDYLNKCQLVFYDVHGMGPDYEFNYMVGGMLKNYLRRDDRVQGIFGLGELGTINSIAGMIAGSSNAVREWDVRDMQKFDIEMMRRGLLPGENYDTTLGPEPEQIWVIDKKTDKPVFTGKTRTKEIYPFSLKRFKEKFGSGWKEGLVKGLKEVLPLALLWLAYQYIKKALEEAFGGKKG